MKYSKFIFFAFVLVFYACNYFSFEKKNITIVDTTVDFSTVDTPPTFDSCKNLIVKQKQDSCFSQTLAKEFSSEVSKKAYQKKLVVNSAINETVRLKIKIDKEGLINLIDLSLSDSLKQEIPEIESIFKKTIKSLPKVYPAIKRGIPVDTEYVLPVNIKLEN